MFNPFTPGFAENPYEEYRIQRETEPIQQTPFGPWMIFDHAESVRLLRDITLSVDNFFEHSFQSLFKLTTIFCTSKH